MNYFEAWNINKYKFLCYLFAKITRITKEIKKMKLKNKDYNHCQCGN